MARFSYTKGDTHSALRPAATTCACYTSVRDTNPARLPVARDATLCAQRLSAAGPASGRAGPWKPAVPRSLRCPVAVVALALAVLVASRVRSPRQRHADRRRRERERTRDLGGRDRVPPVAERHDLDVRRQLRPPAAPRRAARAIALLPAPTAGAGDSVASSASSSGASWVPPGIRPERTSGTSRTAASAARTPTTTASGSSARSP